MRKIILLFTVFLLTSCSTKSIKIIIENTLDFNRNKEIVEVSTAGFDLDFTKKTYILKDEKGVETGFQLLSDNQTIIFHVNVPAKTSVAYTLQEEKLTETSVPVVARTFVRFVPERSDDIAWENDIAAYRMYGPALMKTQNPSNGVDIWMKYEDEPVMDKLYEGELQKNTTYHEDNGLGGLDCYDVNHTLGAGGVAPYTNRLWVGNAFDRYEIIEQGPLRSVFKLYYDKSIPVEDGFFSGVLTVTCDAASPLNKGVIKYEGAKPIRVATGIFMHRDSVNTVFNRENKFISYTKNAFSNKGVPQGQTYIGVYAPEMTGIPLIKDGQFIVLHNYKIGEELTYYFGGGWSKWKFPTEQNWLSAMVHFSQTKQNPLKVTLQLTNE